MQFVISTNENTQAQAPIVIEIDYKDLARQITLYNSGVSQTIPFCTATKQTC